MEAAFLRLIDAECIKMGGAVSQPTEKQPYGLTPDGVANSIPTRAVVEGMSDNEITERIRNAADVERVMRNPYLIEQELRLHGVRRRPDA